MTSVNDHSQQRCNLKYHEYIAQRYSNSMRSAREGISIKIDNYLMRGNRA